MIMGNTSVEIYCCVVRYIQAKFIAMKSREAKQKAEEDSRNQILQAFFATEELRMEVQRKSLEAVMTQSLAAMKKSLALVDQRIAPVVQVQSGYKSQSEFSPEEFRP